MAKLQRISFKKDNIISENFWSVKFDLTDDLDKSNYETMVHVIYSRIDNKPKTVGIVYMLCGAIDNTRNVFEQFDINFICEKNVELNASETPESFTNTHITNEKYFDKAETLLDNLVKQNKLNLVFEMNKAIKKCEAKVAK